VNIALVAPRYAPFVGGLEKHVARLGEELRGFGHTVQVLTQHEKTAHVRACEAIDGIEVRRFPIRIGGGSYPVAPALWRHLRRHAKDFDVVNAFSYHATTVVGAATSRSGNLVFTPVYLGTGRTRIARVAHGPYRILGNWLFASASQVICGTNAEAALIRRRFRSAHDLTVVPPGIDVEKIATSEPFTTEETVVCVASRLERYKRVDVSIAALAKLDKEVRLVVLGDGPDRPRLTELARELGIASRVEFLGAVSYDNVYRWLRTATVFISMSERESFGLTLLEAVAAGCHVVASDIAPHCEIVEQFSTKGIALIPSDAGAQRLAFAIESQLSATAPVDAVSTPTWRDHANATLSVYDRV
jgi:glycosyltransferase involved in cell wall biosynthesis